MIAVADRHADANGAPPEGILPRRGKPKFGAAKLIIQQVTKKKDAKAGGAAAPDNSKPQARFVPCSFHDDRGVRAVCKLSPSLCEEFSGRTLRIISRSQPGVAFYVKARPEAGSEAVRGVSILRCISERSGIVDREVELRVVSDEEATLSEVIFVVTDRYLSKRDIWHLHIAMVQDGGQVLYSADDRGLRQLIPKSRIQQLAAGPDRTPVFSGLVRSSNPGTEIYFRSETANMFVLIQVSAEMWEYGPSGAPYWESVLECYAELLERSLRVPASANSNGHYVRMVLFARVKNNYRPLDEPLPLESESHKYDGEYEDFYDIFWEGFTSAMPSSQILVGRARRVCVGLHENWLRLQRLIGEADVGPRSNGGQDAGDGPKGSSSRGEWRGVNPADIVQASLGNTFECLNIVLDHFDNHYLDRMLRSMGQMLVLLTAGNGVIESSAKLYELTHRRFAITSPTSFHMICVRGPPKHNVPWVNWPGGPSPHCSKAAESFGAFARNGAVRDDLLVSCPSWIRLSYRLDVEPCLCGGWDYCSPAFLPIEDCTPRQGSKLFVPSIDGDIFNDCYASTAPPPSSGLGKQRRQCKAEPCKLRPVPWDEIRLPTLCAPLNRRPLGKETVGDVGAWTEYSVCPKRFSYAGDSGEQYNMMNDLIGLRLEVITGAQTYPESKVTPDSAPSLPMPLSPRKLPIKSASCHELALRESLSPRPAARRAERDVWLMQGNKIPPELRCMSVRAGAGIQWRFTPRAHGLSVSQMGTSQEVHAGIGARLAYNYSNFYVRRHMAWRDVSASPIQTDDAEPPKDRERGGDENWTPGRLIFHPPMQPEWNLLDTITSGNLPMPPALPYPVEPTSAANCDRCPGWKLRSAMKQNMFVLIPQNEKERDHRRCFTHAMKMLGGSINIGQDFFELLEPSPPGSDSFARSSCLCGAGDENPPNGHSGPHCSECREALVMDPDSRERTLRGFRMFKAGLEDLCFGGEHAVGTGLSGARKALHIEVDANSTTFEVRRANSTVYVRDMNIESAFTSSRDWFEIFYDHIFVPPKLFLFGLQWVVCSSVHLVHFVSNLHRLAEESGFALLRIPIAQLFPQPAPYWIWNGDRETMFNRLAFYPCRKMHLPQSWSREYMERLYAELLMRWQDEPLGFLVLFSSPVRDFKVDVTPYSDVDACRAKHQVFQRSKGWVLCDADGLCLIALRPKSIRWYENRLLFSDARDWRVTEKRVRRCDGQRRAFYKATDEVLRKVGEIRLQSEPACSPRSLFGGCGSPRTEKDNFDRESCVGSDPDDFD